MKKLLFVLLATLALFSCTENERARGYGGSSTYNVPKGLKVINVTWKEADMWVLTRKMTQADSAEVYHFIEDSNYGVLEGQVHIVESR